MVLLNAYDVVIHASELRYWVLMLGCVVAGTWLVRRFSGFDETVRNRALKQMGGFIVLLQVGYQLYMMVHPDFHWSLHH